MAKTESNIGFEEFRRYQTGEMSSEEQHKLEKRMLEDPLVAEAFEGFLMMPTDATHVGTELSQALHDRINLKKRRVIPIWTYAAAASVLISLGAYWLVFLSDKKSSEQSMVTDAIVVEAPKIAPKQELSPNILPKPAPSSPGNDPAPSVAQHLPDAATLKSTSPASKPLAIAAIPAQTEKDTETQNFEEAILADKNEEQIAVAEPVQAASQAAPPSAPALAKQMQVKNKQGSENAKLAGATALSESLAPAADTVPRPRIGWEAYQAYLQKSTYGKVDSDPVTVHFTVNADGTLSKFKVNGNQKNLFAKAIRIVKNGPAWYPSKFNGSDKAAPQQLILRFHSTN